MVRTVFASSALSSTAAAPPRLSELRSWMARQGLEAAYVTRPVSIAYLTGFRADPHERLMALAVRPDSATLIVPALERENAAATSAHADVVAWRDGEDPYDIVREARDYVLLDFGAAVEGYRADTTRMAVVGAPSARQLEIHNLVLKAHDAAVAAVRPGVTTGDVDAAARKVITAAGLGDRFFHRVGHGLGLESHEDPSLDPGSDTVLEPGMVFTVEPGFY